MKQSSEAQVKETKATIDQTKKDHFKAIQKSSESLYQEMNNCLKSELKRVQKILLKFPLKNVFLYHAVQSDQKHINYQNKNYFNW